MIFSSQLGKLDGQNTERSLKSISNHLRKMQEELEYRFANLDSSNIGEINADQTNVFVKGKDINNIIADQDGKMSQFQQTVEGFQKTVADYEKGYSEWTQTVDGFNKQVGDYKSKVTEWTQTVDGFTQQVADYTTGYSTWEQTVAGFNQQVSNYEGQYTSWTQKVDEFNATVQNFQNGLATTLKMDETGVYITDQNGRTVTISGGQIDASTINASQIRVNNLYGETINLKYRLNPPIFQNGQLIEYLNAGSIQVNEGSSSAYAVDLHSNYGLRLQADVGDAYVSSAYGYVTLHGASGNTSKGNFMPSGNGMYTLGTPYYLWSDVYSSNTEIVTSDREKKNSIDYDTEKYGKLFDLLKPCSYKLNDGSSGRRHIGMISQDVEEALESAGLTAADFAGFIKSPRKDEDGSEIEGEYDYALRYGEFIGLCITEIQKLKARVYELERKEQNDGSAC